ncbi:MAG TPA: trypsin-like peptidase domain-containing protein [Rubricoccaceae bacterium]
MRVATRKLSTALLVAAAFLGGIFFVTSAANLTGLPALLRSADAQNEATAAQAVATAEELGQAFSSVAERVNPAVVQVRATRLASSSAPSDPFGGQSPFGGQNPFGFGGPGGEQEGLGSGAFIQSDGYVVTNNHVVEGADELSVRLFDGRVLPATVVGADPFSDIAVLKVEGDDFPALSFAASEELRVGQWVLAFGSPLSEDLSNTVTNGIVSSLGRYQGGNGSISNYIQTDAAVNPGNSGGPLVNLRGEIVGINSAIATRTGGFQGISFAVPADIVRNTTEQLVASGTVQRGYLGISFGAVSPSLARALDVPLGAAQIGGLAEDGEGREPASEAGLRIDDVITAVDGVTLTDSRQLVSLVSNKRPGDTVRLTYNRDGDERTATVRLGTRPSDEQMAGASGGATPRRNAPDAEPATESALGLTVQDLTPAVARRIGAEGDVEGIAVTAVERTSEAFRDAQIRPGVVITEVNRRPVRTVAELQRAIAAVDPGDTFLVRVLDPRSDASRLTALTKPG